MKSQIAGAILSSCMVISSAAQAMPNGEVFYDERTEMIATISVVQGMQANSHFSDYDSDRGMETAYCFLTQIKSKGLDSFQAIEWVEVTSRMLAGYTTAYTRNAVQMVNKDVLGPCTDYKLSTDMGYIK